VHRRWQILGRAAAYDVVCIHRAFLDPLELRLLQRGGRRYLFDFDDAIMFRDSTHSRFDSWQRRWAFRRMVRGAHMSIAGNAYLAQCAARYSERVTVIPTAIDLSAYPPRPLESAPEPVVGWIGTRVNLMYLQRIFPALRRLAERRPGLKLKIVSDGFPDHVPGVDLIRKPWSRSDECADLASFQVGVMPLPDDPWTRGKCAVKILQYFAASLPVVCSPVGANRDVVEPSRNGYFAGTETEWVARLDELLANPEQRRRFGKHGRALVERRFSVESNLPALTRLFESA
jgi:glycosyltransferase involved in cell wall biosynthesis